MAKHLTVIAACAVGLSTAQVASAQGNFWIWGGDMTVGVDPIAPGFANNLLTRLMSDDVQLAPGYTGQRLKATRIFARNLGTTSFLFRWRACVHRQNSTPIGSTGISSPGTYVTHTIDSASIASSSSLRLTREITQPGPLLVADNLWLGVSFDNNAGSAAYANQTQLNQLGVFLQAPTYGSSTENIWRSTNPAPGNSSQAANSGVQFDPSSAATNYGLSMGLAIMGQDFVGALSLQDTASPLAVGRSITYQVTQGTTVMQSTQVIMASSNTALISVVVPSIAPTWGTNIYDVVFDGGPYLKKKVTLIAPPGTSGVAPVALPLGTVNLVNGDVDESGEVDAADIDQVIADFGANWPGGTGNPFSDVDSSGEVDAADIDIVIANFGAVDD